MHNYFPSLIIRCLSIVSHRFLRAFSVLPTYHFRVTHGPNNVENLRKHGMNLKGIV